MVEQEGYRLDWDAFMREQEKGIQDSEYRQLFPGMLFTGLGLQKWDLYAGYCMSIIAQ